jgi:plastocyanin
VAGGILRTIVGNSLGREIPLEADVVVGRSETGMDDLGGDTEISRRHARFRRTEQGQVIVEDLGSTNGTLVNGRRIGGPQLLSQGDQITLGKTVLQSDAGPRATDVHAVQPVPIASPVSPASPVRVLIRLALGTLTAAGFYVWAKNLTPDYSTSLFGQTAAGTFPLKSWLGTALLALAVLQTFTALWLYGKVRSKRLPGFALPLAGGTVVTVIVVLWYSAALWYFNDMSVPLLSSARASTPSSGTAAPAPAYPTAAAAVAMKNIQFAPKDLAAKAGQTITWTNQDSVDHNVTAVGGASFKSANFGKGGTYRYRPASAGRISYVCTLHPGTAGTITVAP